MKNDPIVVRETLARIEKVADAARRGTKAANALLWFHEHAAPTVRADSVLESKVAVIASATAHAKEAQHFINLAAGEFLDQIIERAMDKAGQELKFADFIEKNGNTR